ncbi:polysaccharide deacetylase family protein [uncultured Paraglaciecola sp.]|uniref:polysaccharide deacetylase family protein n=1 Tax=uncultured Paraglaciecola sp. TaxID=1765024 RepID=UPI0030D9BBEE|tara:strand:- start:3831 stop:4640 length:810 start_codon:yes stop_codon:yes gene_type:complete
MLIAHYSSAILLMIGLFFTVNQSAFAEQNNWLKAGKVAISLSYDDALLSQLENVVPALNKRELKASFYVVPLSPEFKDRLPQWRALAKQGHELGNHSLFHACKGSLPGREWVQPENDLDTRTVGAMVNEITVANTLLHAVDGETIRTFTPPCFDQQTQNGNYLLAVKTQFIAVKSCDANDFSVLIAPENLTAKQIIAFIESQPKNIKLVNILFHGVGGDHLITATAEHNALLDYFVNHQDKYWVDTYRNIRLAVPPKPDEFPNSDVCPG